MYTIEKTTNGLYERFNMGHYTEWYRKVQPERENKYVLHPLVGKKYMYVWSEGNAPEEVEIKYVVKHWYAGYYYHAVYEKAGGSSGTVVIENINSIAGLVEESFKRFQEEFTEVS